MKSLRDLIRLKKQIRVIGFDDAPFGRERGSQVNISGVLCAGTRMEGMLWCEATKDGQDATQALITAVMASKFYDQIHAVLIDGIAVGGFNVIDLALLAKALKRPCITVMRKHPDLSAIKAALANFADGEARWQVIKRAGQIYSHQCESGNTEFYFQVIGAEPSEVAHLLELVTDNGNVPEALRLAHLIGSAVKTGQSSNSA